MLQPTYKKLQVACQKHLIKDTRANKVDQCVTEIGGGRRMCISLLAISMNHK